MEYLHTLDKQLQPLLQPLKERLGPTFTQLGVPKLTDHFHVLIATFIACVLIQIFSRTLSPLIFPKTYPHLKGSVRANWDIHVVSMVHCLTIVTLAYPILSDPLLLKNKIFGYSPYAANVYSVACGYFAWDALTSLYNVRAFGIGFVLHGISCFMVFIFSLVSSQGFFVQR